MAEVTKSLRAECNTATDVTKENELAKLEQFQTYGLRTHYPPTSFKK